METIAFCEFDKHAQKVLKKHWPNVPIYEDVRTLDGKQFRGTVDVVCGGFPCQDLSGAGKQAGFNGDRSSLYIEMLRIIGECRPKYALFENVAALLTGESGRWFAQFLYDLAEVGYDAEWHCIPASYIGAPHIRYRVWIIAYPNAAENSFSSFGEVLSQYKMPGGDFQREWGGSMPRVSRVDDGISKRLDRLARLGNAVVPQIPEAIGRAIMQCES
jgi:DNA (cytosine-5)-methyltransferase 1